MPRRGSTSNGSKLPNAPLVEVVFEVRWQLVGLPDAPPPLQRDPGYFQCLDTLFEKVKTLGFKVRKLAGTSGWLPHTVEHRFYRSDTESFPVIQIGPGVFAVNESTAYTWDGFRELCLSAVALLLSSYPKLTAFPFTPTQLELRYIDAFKPTAPHSNLFDFLNNSTQLRFELPPFLRSEHFDPIREAQIDVTVPLRGTKDSRFAIRLSRRDVDNTPSVLMQTAYTTTSGSLIGKPGALSTTSLQRWLDDAHEVASPFFKEFVSDSLMAQFKAASNV
jgi:uncharacterized protein (TIGR04255 family)